MTENIQEQITLLENTKDENRTAIMEKGVMVYASDLYSTYPTRISQISMTAGDKDDVLKAIIDRSITSINIPYGISEIKEQCFNGCSLLEEVTIPDTVKTIGNNAFNHCTSLSSITIPASVETLVGCTFCDTGLTSITFLSETPADLQGTSLTGNYPIYVPADSVDTYKSAWSNYASRIQEAPEPSVQRFVKITDINQITDGTYLVVDTSAQIALNASLIKYTMATIGGLNGNNNVNTINVTITDGDTIEANETTLNAAVYYDSTNQCLTWTDPDTATLYYIQWKTGTTFAYDQDRFNKNQYNVSPKSVNGNFTFWSGSGVRTMGKHNQYNLIRFYSENNSAYYTNIALFKLS